MYKENLAAEMVEPSEDLKEYFSWAESRGIRWPKIVYPVKFPPGYYGSMAKEEIFPNERIITAPNDVLFTAKLAYEGDLRPIFDKCPDTFKRPMLILITFLKG